MLPCMMPLGLVQCQLPKLCMMRRTSENSADVDPETTLPISLLIIKMSIPNFRDHNLAPQSLLY